MLNNKVSIKKQAIGICTLAAVFYCYEYYLRVAPSVISQELMRTFNISNAGLGLLSALFYYAYMPLQIPVGLLIDKFGTRLVLTFACLLCVVGTYVFAITNSLLVAQIGRFLVGFGSAFAFVGFLKICTNWLPHKFYAMMVGLCMLLGMLGAISGEVFLAKLMQQMSWRNALLIAAITGVILTLFMWVIIRDEPTESEDPDATLNNSTTLISALIKALKNPQIWLISIIGCFTFLPLSSFAEMWAVPYLETIGYPKTQAAYASSMIFLGFGLGGPLFGLVSNWLCSRRIPLIVGALVSGVSATIIVMYPYLPIGYMLGALFLLGFFSSAEILVFAIGNDITPKSNSGTTIAIINMIVMLGGIILQPVIGIILDIISSSTASQYQTALLVLPISLFIAAGLSIILTETFKS